VLGSGELCHVAALTARGPHVTPMVFALAADRVWVTTSRGSVKARAWRLDPRIAGLVRSDEVAVCFTGTATMYDLLDPDTWGRSIREGPRLALAASRFTRKNARFFAGYAVDAHHVPFAWTPPGRVFAELSIERCAVIEDGAVTSVWGDWGTEVPSVASFRASRTGSSAFEPLPEDVREALGATGEGALGLSTPSGPVVVPARWRLEGPALYAATGEEVLGLAEVAEASVPAALQVDRASWWRARAMVGAMARGAGDLVVPGRLASGGRSASGLAARAGTRTDAPALVRLRPETIVWWRGWSSGTVSAP
jgi:nitroimidazol reductase NimA-like FMN-containing flavoprotein (pyridoxamine 5'-phosphate oxidase superfamily)